MRKAVTIEKARPMTREGVGADPGPLQTLAERGETLRDPGPQTSVEHASLAPFRPVLACLLLLLAHAGRVLATV